LRSHELVTAGILLVVAASPAASQVQIGNFNLNGNGTLSTGYTGGFGNLTSSDHGITFGGAGNLTGSFYNPNFISFNIQPFLNQSRENSNYQSISDTSGVSATTSIFGGSNFPGTVGYTRTFNSQGNFNVPGVADYTSHGDSQVFSVGWSEIVPNLPTLSMGFQDGTNNYSLYGANGDLSSDFRTFNLNSNYRIAGFNLNGNYSNSWSDSQMPALLGNPAQSSDSTTQSFGFGISHRLPFDGTFSASASRSDISADFSSGTYNADIDSLNSGVSFSPFSHLNVGLNFQYVDNLAATLEQPLVAAGGEVQNSPDASHSLSMSAFASYALPTLHLTLNATDEYRVQDFMGEAFRSDSQTGSISYNNVLLGGYLNATAGATYSEVSTNHLGVLGLMGSVSFARDVKGWSTSTTVHYSQNVETALIAYTTSGYGYSSSLGHKLGRRSHWAVNAAGSRGTFNNQGGSATFSQSYSTVVSVRWIGVSGAYSRSSGNSVLTSSGLVPVTVPVSAIGPSSVILYGGTAYSGGIGITPKRGFTFTVSYSKALSNTQGDSTDSNNKIEQLNMYLQYQFRKMYFTGGYSRLTQSFSSNGNLPAMVGSFYFGISRWFNFL